MIEPDYFIVVTNQEEALLSDFKSRGLQYIRGEESMTQWNDRTDQLRQDQVPDYRQLIYVDTPTDNWQDKEFEDIIANIRDQLDQVTHVAIWRQYDDLSAMTSHASNLKAPSFLILELPDEEYALYVDYRSH